VPCEAEAVGAANGPGACELPACAGLGPVSAEAHFEGKSNGGSGGPARTGWLLRVAQDGGSPGWWSRRA
jgi:hypothetical protein